MKLNHSNDMAIKLIHLHEDGTQHVEILFNSEEALYTAVVEFVRVKSYISISLLQRQFYLGYSVALRTMQRMAQEEIVKYVQPKGYWKVLI